MAQETERRKHPLALWSSLWGEDGGRSRRIPGVLTLDVTRTVVPPRERGGRAGLLGSVSGSLQGIFSGSGEEVPGEDVKTGLWGCPSGAGEDNSLSRELENFCLEQFSVREGVGVQLLRGHDSRYVVS